ncbi:hypothetical protein BJY00DRAFT_58600 [Aspergillus carlsbadensis]|nr:hypothetical protein BJY00DRAFT_58600 [Aspergillus carlsbadensis]
MAQADFLDKRGHDSLTRAVGAVGGNARGTHLAHKNRRNALSIYRQLYYTTRSELGALSWAYDWMAKRLAGLLELWGCIRRPRWQTRGAW